MCLPVNIKDIIIRKADVKDLNQICEVFTLSIEKTCHNDYNAPQISAWSSAATNHVKWIHKISTLFFIVAEKENRIVGFAALEQNTIDLLYVHPDFQQMGIASHLLSVVITEARCHSYTTIKTEASNTAKQFFINNGFDITEKNNARVNGIEIPNWKMTKQLY